MMTATLPNFLLAGAAKSGTTSLHEYLGQHPEIFMSSEKEPHYFVHDYGIEKWRQYVDLFQNAAGRKIIGESSGGYLYSCESPAWIKAVLGNIKTVTLLRNPADRAFSLYGWMVREGYEDASTFREALEREPTRAGDPAFHAHCPQFLPNYLYYASGLYYEQVSRHFKNFGRENVRIYLFEDFIRDPLAICRDVFAFLGVRSNVTPRVEIHNEGRVPPCIRLQDRLRNKAPRRLKAIPGRLRKPLIRVLLERNRRRAMPLAPDPEIQAGLAARYREDILRLQDLLHRDLSAWLKTGSAAPNPPPGRA